MTPATARVLQTWQDMQRPYRACELCKHAVALLLPAGELACGNVRVRGQHAPLPLPQARAQGGGCGPDAWQQVPR